MMAKHHANATPDEWWSSVIKRAFEQNVSEAFIAWQDMQTQQKRAEKMARLLDAFRAEPERSQAPKMKRCESTGGGPPPFRCGLPDGHDGDHSALIPTSMPWFRTKRS